MDITQKCLFSAKVQPNGYRWQFEHLSLLTATGSWRHLWSAAFNFFSTNYPRSFHLARELINNCTKLHLATAIHISIKFQYNIFISIISILKELYLSYSSEKNCIVLFEWILLTNCHLIKKARHKSIWRDNNIIRIAKPSHSINNEYFLFFFYNCNRLLLFSTLFIHIHALFHERAFLLFQPRKQKAIG